MRIGVEDVLRAVAVVDVVVDDGDLRGTLRAGVGGRNGDVVEQAEAHRAVALGVVSRRADHRHGGLVRSAHHPLDGVDGGAGGEQRDLVRFRRRVGVGIDLRGLAGGFRHPPDVFAIVHAGELLDRRRARCDDLGPLLTPRGGHRVHDLGPLGTLGMARRRLVLGESIGMNQDHEVSSCRLSRARSFRFARFIITAMSGATNAEKPDGLPRLRRVIRVWPPSTACQV